MSERLKKTDSLEIHYIHCEKTLTLQMLHPRLEKCATKRKAASRRGGGEEITGRMKARAAPAHTSAKSSKPRFCLPAIPHDLSARRTSPRGMSVTAFALRSGWKNALLASADGATAGSRK